MPATNGVKVGPLPLGGDKLLAMRLKRQDPDGLVVVTFVGRQEAFAEHFTLLASPGTEYDWRIIKGLDLCLLVKPGLAGVAKSMKAIAQEVYPGTAFCWDIERQVGSELSAFPTVESIDQPKDRWRYKLDAIPWTAGQNDRWKTC